MYCRIIMFILSMLFDILNPSYLNLKILAFHDLIFHSIEQGKFMFESYSVSKFKRIKCCEQLCNSLSLFFSLFPNRRVFWSKSIAFWPGGISCLGWGRSLICIFSATCKISICHATLIAYHLLSSCYCFPIRTLLNLSWCNFNVCTWN